MELPQAFTERMQKMLGSEYADFYHSYTKTGRRGLRVNTLKITEAEFEQITPFAVERIPWTRNGYFYSGDAMPARHPFYAAGLYYLQEPSAMTPADRLPVTPGERVLDLCAAPGGKATELASKLKGKGLLVANDASNSRAKALLRNLELFGAKNILVTAEMPERLCTVFPSFFDKIQVDAPCSGEGMFRKSPDVIHTWSPEKVSTCSKQQKNILACAREMLRPGGMLMYSTCTFSPEENEQVIAWFTKTYSDMEIVPIEPWYDGFSEGNPAWADGNENLKKCVRIWPHKMDGEGHFLCLLRRRADIGEETVLPAGSERKNKKQRKARQTGSTSAKMTGDQKELLEQFLNGKATGILDLSAIEQRADKAWLTQQLPDGVKGMNFLRNGLYLGEWKTKRFEPSQPFAMTLSADTWKNALQLDPEDERIDRYMRGETLEITPSDQVSDGWVLVCVKKYSLGWGKVAGGRMKNKLLGSWRW